MTSPELIGDHPSSSPTPVRADALVTDRSGCVLTVGDARFHLTWRWLRDHARDPASFHAGAHQRLVSPTEVLAAGPAQARLTDDGAILSLDWPDGTTATWAVGWLTATATDASAAVDLTDVWGAPAPWWGVDLDDRLTRLAPTALADADGLTEALLGLARDGAVLLSGVSTDHAATRATIERFGRLQTTIFGELWEFRSDGGFDDTASTPLEITPHTDGTYVADAPGLLALHCHAYDATGGENVLVCGQAVSDRLATDSPQHHHVLRTVEVAGQYVGDGAHLMAARAPLRLAGDRLVQISYNHHDRAPLRRPEPEMSELLDALAHLDAIAADPAMQFEIPLRPGDLLVIDNWRVLHGRRAFAGDRLMAGGYVGRDDLASTARLLLGAGSST